jgi:hypothetical protein
MMDYIDNALTTEIQGCGSKAKQSVADLVTMEFVRNVLTSASSAYAKEFQKHRMDLISNNEGIDNQVAAQRLTLAEAHLLKAHVPPPMVPPKISRDMAKYFLYQQGYQTNRKHA